MNNANIPAIFIDRDGTINAGTTRVICPEQLIVLPEAISAIKQLNEAGFLVIVITNQSGIARGLVTAETLAMINQKLTDVLSQGGAKIDALYFCPHHPDYDLDCDCRKPKTGLIEQACRDFNIDLKNSWLIGDTTGDMETARRAGLQSILVKTGYGGEDQSYPGSINYIAKDIAEAAAYILKSAKPISRKKNTF